MAGRDGTGGARPHRGGLAVRTGGCGHHPDREAQPATQRGDPRALRAGPGRSVGRPARRAVPRRALLVEGRRGGARRHTLQRGARVRRRLPLDRDPDADTALHRWRLRHLRQDQHARARHIADHRAASLRALAQPVEHRALDRRVLGRLGRRGGVGHGAGRPRQRRWRLHPHTRVVLRPRGVEADAGAQFRGAAVRRHDGRPGGRARGDALGARLGGHPRRDRRPGSR